MYFFRHQYKLINYYFFFSSKRRHTRSLCDWSSDVCSSDLAGDLLAITRIVIRGERHSVSAGAPNRQQVPRLDFAQRPIVRSEERRVGKECRSKVRPNHIKDNKHNTIIKINLLRTKIKNTIQ